MTIVTIHWQLAYYYDVVGVVVVDDGDDISFFGDRTKLTTPTVMITHFVNQATIPLPLSLEHVTINTAAVELAMGSRSD